MSAFNWICRKCGKEFELLAGLEEHQCKRYELSDGSVIYVEGGSPDDLYMASIPKGTRINITAIVNGRMIVENRKVTIK